MPIFVGKYGAKLSYINIYYPVDSSSRVLLLISASLIVEYINKYL